MKQEKRAGQHVFADVPPAAEIEERLRDVRRECAILVAFIRLTGQTEEALARGWLSADSFLRRLPTREAIEAQRRRSYQEGIALEKLLRLARRAERERERETQCA
jgi:hypothetical protein